MVSNLLTNVFVLIQSLLCQVALAQIHAELQVLEHDGLVYLLPCSMFFALDDIVEHIQSWLLFTNFKKLWEKKKTVMTTTLSGISLWHIQHPDGTDWLKNVSWSCCSFFYHRYRPQIPLPTQKGHLQLAVILNEHRKQPYTLAAIPLIFCIYIFVQMTTYLLFIHEQGLSYSLKGFLSANC